MNSKPMPQNAYFQHLELLHNLLNVNVPNETARILREVKEPYQHKYLVELEQYRKGIIARMQRLEGLDQEIPDKVVGEIFKLLLEKEKLVKITNEQDLRFNELMRIFPAEAIIDYLQMRFDKLKKK